MRRRRLLQQQPIGTSRYLKLVTGNIICSPLLVNNGSCTSRLGITVVLAAGIDYYYFGANNQLITNHPHPDNHPCTPPGVPDDDETNILLYLLLLDQL
jgi:hypothetical protein